MILHCFEIHLYIMTVLSFNDFYSLEHILLCHTTTTTTTTKHSWSLVQWWMYYYLLPLIFCWIILIDNSWWLFWAHLNRACLIHPLHSATNTTIGKYQGAQHWSKRAHLNTSGKSLGAISKQLQVPRSTVPTTVSLKCTAQLSHCHQQEENTNDHTPLKTENWSGWSRVSKKTPKGEDYQKLVDGFQKHITEVRNGRETLNQI